MGSWCYPKTVNSYNYYCTNSKNTSYVYQMNERLWNLYYDTDEKITFAWDQT